MKSYSLYLKTYSIFLIFSLISFSIFNILVDYQRIFRVAEIPRFNQKKPFADNWPYWMETLRRRKVREIEQGDYNTIILGSSRVMTGLDPRHRGFGDRSVYNAGLQLSNMYETYQVFKFAREHLNLEQVVLELSLSDFSAQRTEVFDFNRSKFAGPKYLPLQTIETLSLENLDYSLKTIKFNLSGRNIASDPYEFIQGFRVRTNEYNLNHRQRFNEYALGFLGADGYPGFEYSQNKLKLFRKLVAECQKNKIKLYLFISPVHARQLELMRVSGIFPVFEQWKRDLVNIMVQEQAKNPKNSLILWDFSGYNSMTTEAIPAANSRAQMTWYLESSHYKKELGNLVLDRVLSYPKIPPHFPQDFGVIIHPDNIEAHLMNIRNDSGGYHQQYPQEIQEVNHLFREVSQTLTDDELVEDRLF